MSKPWTLTVLLCFRLAALSCWSRRPWPWGVPHCIVLWVEGAAGNCLHVLPQMS